MQVIHVTAKRGRLPTEQTKETKRINDMLANSPSHISDLEPDVCGQNLIQGLEESRKTLLEGYSPTIKRDLVYRLHNFLEDYPNQYPHPEAVKEYKLKVRAVKDGQKEGGKQTQEKAKRFAEMLLGKNKDLLDRRKPKGNLTVHGIATIIYDEWPKRGIEGEKPKSVKQITQYIKAYS